MTFSAGFRFFRQAVSPWLILCQPNLPKSISKAYGWVNWHGLRKPLLLISSFTFSYNFPCKSWVNYTICNLAISKNHEISMPVQDFRKMLKISVMRERMCLLGDYDTEYDILLTYLHYWNVERESPTQRIQLQGILSCVTILQTVRLGGCIFFLPEYMREAVFFFHRHVKYCGSKLPSLNR